MTSAASAIDRHPGWQNRVSDAKLVGDKPPLWWVTRAFIGIVVIAVLMLVVNTWRQSLIEEGIAQGKQLGQVEREQWRSDLMASKAELARTELALKAEIKRKQELAVENTRIKGERDQAVADHRTLANKLRTIEAKKSPPPPPARTRRG